MPLQPLPLQNALIGNCREVMAMAANTNCRHATTKIRCAVTAYAAHLYRRRRSAVHAGGGEFLYNQQVIQRCFRDIHAANSHYALAWDIATTMAGKSLLGIAADLPTL
jgi:hypothetical protein